MTYLNVCCCGWIVKCQHKSNSNEHWGDLNGLSGVRVTSLHLTFMSVIFLCVVYYVVCHMWFMWSGILKKLRSCDATAAKIRSFTSWWIRTALTLQLQSACLLLFVGNNWSSFTPLPGSCYSHRKIESGRAMKREWNENDKLHSEVITQLTSSKMLALADCCLLTHVSHVSDDVSAFLTASPLPSMSDVHLGFTKRSWRLPSTW